MEAEPAYKKMDTVVKLDSVSFSGVSLDHFIFIDFHTLLPQLTLCYVVPHPVL